MTGWGAALAPKRRKDTARVQRSTAVRQLISVWAADAVRAADHVLEWSERIIF
jgi:hypothetical protein